MKDASGDPAATDANARAETELAKALKTDTALIQSRVTPPTAAELEYGLRGVFTRLASGDAPLRRARWRWSLVGMATAACVTAAVIALALSPWRLRPQVSGGSAPPPPAELTYRVHGGNLIAGGYLREVGSDGISLSFSEGTEFMLTSGTHGRLRSVGAAGARIAIEQGTAHFQVTPNTGRTWLVDVGPFLVTVKGTVFTVSWDSSHERFELRLRRGRVAVSGPLPNGDILLLDGQRLTVDLRHAQTLISADPGDLPEKEAPGAGPALAAPADAHAPGPGPSGVADGLGRGRPAALAPGRSVRGERSRRWSEALASGDWDAILTDADRAGTGEVLARASSEELYALADAARYRRRLDLARDALLAQRRRFPASTRALDAALQLGRVEEATRQGSVRALRWYEEYLARAPSGTYASEALGRRMTLTKQRAGSARARPIAEEYLRRFPAGTYAGSARALLVH
jgi:hypothetical protein